MSTVRLSPVSGATHLIVLGPRTRKPTIDRLPVGLSASVLSHEDANRNGRITTNTYDQRNRTLTSQGNTGGIAANTSFVHDATSNLGEEKGTAKKRGHH